MFTDNDFTNLNGTARKLIEAFSQFKRLQFKQQPPFCGLTNGETMVLFAIRNLLKNDEEGVKVSQISSHLRVAPPTVSQFINCLEEKGFVERKLDKEDRRAIRVVLTQKGEDALKEAFSQFCRIVEDLIEYLGEDKAVELADLMTKVFIYFKEVRGINEAKKDKGDGVIA